MEFPTFQPDSTYNRQSILSPLANFLTGVLSAVILYLGAVKLFPQLARVTEAAVAEPIEQPALRQVNANAYQQNVRND